MLIWAWLKIFDRVQKIFGGCNTVWTWSKKNWTGRWNRQEMKKTATWGRWVSKKWIAGRRLLWMVPSWFLFSFFFYSSNPRVPCHSLPYLDLSHWREEVTQCRVNGLDIILGSSKKISPCTSCTCTKEGVIIIIFSKNIRARKKEKKLWNDSKIKLTRHYFWIL